MTATIGQSLRSQFNHLFSRTRVAAAQATPEGTGTDPAAAADPSDKAEWTPRQRDLAKSGAIGAGIGIAAGVAMVAGGVPIPGFLGFLTAVGGVTVGGVAAAAHLLHKHVGPALDRGLARLFETPEAREQWSRIATVAAGVALSLPALAAGVATGVGLLYGVSTGVPGVGLALAALGVGVGGAIGAGVLMSPQLGRE